MAIRADKKLLGLSLIESGLLTRDQLDLALKVHRKSGNTLGCTLIQEGYISEAQLLNFLQSKLGFPHAALANYVVDANALRVIPENLVRKYEIFPLIKVKNTLTVAMVDPLDGFILENIQLVTGCEIKPLVSTRQEILDAISKYYKKGVTAKKEDGLSALKQLADNIQGIKTEKSTHLVDENDVSQANIINLVNKLIQDAVITRASDIHIEPTETNVRVRFRRDGILEEVMSLSKDWASPLTSRIKVMAELDISEKRKPHDGRARIKLADNREVDLRVSTFPCVTGEKAVLRILDKGNIVLAMDQLGFNDYVLKNFHQMIKAPNGIILVTGPTGSGKTSTLYAALKEIDSTEKNVITIEDPVEYRLSNINQGQVNVKAGFSFASGLRSMLRQDPDVIMVGEIRDLETAEISIRASLTGHLVFSTLHTNDASGSLNRLIDMGVEPFLVASAIIGAMAQRLVRTTCPECKSPVKVSDRLFGELGISRERVGNVQFYRGKGCSNCKNTGYTGRTCITELLINGEDIRELVVRKSSTTMIKVASKKGGMKTLREDGLAKAVRGITTLQEVLRVTARDE
ncbi:MAG: type II secretion system protein GspE [Candidatus Cloacimonadota bacterium]|nr:MAG: type II secretion system protein GspE [Candidatus Cloacimonadota bacterium]